MAGWIKLHRKLLEWEWKDKPSTFALFVHLLLEASYEDNNWRGIDLKAGQLITGRKKLAQSTGLSESSIRRSLKDLQMSQQITSKTTSKYSIISITNWELYQDDRQQTDQQTDQQTASKPTTTKEYKNIKIEEYIGGTLPPKTPKQKKGSRLPADWQCSTALGEWAMEEYGLTVSDIKSEIFHFIDYWQAKAGASAVKLDWDATFRNWVRNNQKWSKK